jgi:hypothetical protein
MVKLQKFEIVRGYHISTIQRATYDTKELGKDLFSAILNNCENDFDDLILNDLYKKLCNKDFQVELLKFISQ